MAIGLEHQLRPLWSFLGYNSDPGMFSQGNVVLQLEAKRFRVEAKCLLLVVHGDAGQVDSHLSNALSSVEIGQRSAMAFSGPPSNQWSFDLPSRLVRISPAAKAVCA